MRRSLLKQAGCGVLALVFVVSCGDGSAAAEAGMPPPDASAVPDAGAAPPDAGPAVCEAFKASQDIRVTDAVGSSLFPDLAWSGTTLGLTWYDERDRNAIMFAALSADGEKLTGDVRLTEPLAIAELPAIAAREGRFGVVWQQYTAGSEEIHFAGVDAAGEVHGPVKQVTQTGDWSSRPVIAPLGDGFAVAWVESPDNAGNEEIYTARLSAAGDRIGDIVRVTDDPSISYAPSIAAVADGYAISWHDFRNGNADLYLARMDANGQPIDAATQLTHHAADALVPSLTRGAEGGYAVAWHDIRGSVWDVYFTLVDATGVPTGVEHLVSDSVQYSTFASGAFTGSEYGIVWQERTSADGDRIGFARYGASGEKRGDTLVVTDDPAPSAQASLVWLRAGFAVAWQDHRDGNYEIYLAILGCR